MMLRWVSTKLGLARPKPKRRGRHDWRAFADTVPTEFAVDDHPTTHSSGWLESSMQLTEGLDVVSDDQTDHLHLPLTN